MAAVAGRAESRARVAAVSRAAGKRVRDMVSVLRVWDEGGLRLRFSPNASSGGEASGGIRKRSDTSRRVDMGGVSWRLDAAGSLDPSRAKTNGNPPART